MSLFSPRTKEARLMQDGVIRIEAGYIKVEVAILGERAVYLTLPKSFVLDHGGGDYQSPTRQYVFLPQQPALLEPD
jgi:hypothetical protein